MMFLPVLLVVLASSVHALVKVSSQKPQPSEDFAHFAIINTAGTFVLYWNYDLETITFEVRASSRVRMLACWYLSGVFSFSLTLVCVERLLGLAVSAASAATDVSLLKKCTSLLMTLFMTRHRREG